jgi:hypothetical protein
MANARPNYEREFYSWTQDQAQAIRALEPGKIGNSIDLERVAGEIEDLGRSELHAVGSHLARLFEHLLKLHFAPQSTARGHWLSEALHFQSEAARRFDNSMRQNLDVEKEWRRASRDAARVLAEMGAVVATTNECPFSLDEALSDNFDIDGALAAIARTHPKQ